MVKYIRESSLILTCQRPVRSSYFFARKEGWRLRAEMEFLTEQLASANGHRRRRASGKRAERASTLGRHAEHPLDAEASRPGAAGAGRAARAANSQRCLLRVQIGTASCRGSG